MGLENRPAITTRLVVDLLGLTLSVTSRFDRICGAWSSTAAHGWPQQQAWLGNRGLSGFGLGRSLFIVRKPIECLLGLIFRLPGEIQGNLCMENLLLHEDW